MFFVCVRTPFTIQRFSGKTCTQTYKSPESFTEMLHFLLHLGEKCQNPSPATGVWGSHTCVDFLIKMYARPLNFSTYCGIIALKQRKEQKWFRL